MQIKVKRPDVQASPPKHEPIPAPTLPEQESGAAEHVYEDRQDAAFDPKGDRAPSGDDRAPASENKRR